MSYLQSYLSMVNKIFKTAAFYYVLALGLFSTESEWPFLIAWISLIGAFVGPIKLFVEKRYE